jgi:hypothetical protein
MASSSENAVQEVSNGVLEQEINTVETHNKTPKVSVGNKEKRPIRKPSTHKQKYQSQPIMDRCSFYDLEVSTKNPDKLDLLKFVGKLWFISISLSREGSAGTKMYRMYTTLECAKSMKIYGDVYVYNLPVPSEDHDPFTLVIHLGVIAKYNPNIKGHQYTNAVKHSLRQIAIKYGIDCICDVRTIMKGEGNKGTVFINFDRSKTNENKVATVRELLAGMCWMMDLNTVSGFSNVMRCDYSKKKL